MGTAGKMVHLLKVCCAAQGPPPQPDTCHEHWLSPLLASFLQHDDGYSDSTPEEDQHDDEDGLDDGQDDH